MFDRPSGSHLWLFIDRISRPAVLVVLMAVYLVFPLYLFPAAAAGSEHMPLDLMFAYSPEQAYAQLASFGPEGRANYARSTVSVDLAYPVIYTLMLAVWLCLLLRGRNRYCSYISMLPFGAFVFDLIENAGILLMLVLPIVLLLQGKTHEKEKAVFSDLIFLTIRPGRRNGDHYRLCTGFSGP